MRIWLSASRASRTSLCAALAGLLAWAACARSDDADRAVAVERRPVITARETLVPREGTWRYLDDGTDPGASWRGATFDDSRWKSGKAQFGYGEGDEATVVSFGPDPKNKYITTYFRVSFELENPQQFANLILRVLADDGAAVSLNGTEIYRENLPAGKLTPTTRAPKRAVANLFIQRTVSPRYLVAGRNVIAVEVHQQSPESPDMSFDLSLAGSESVALLRGPYLQVGTPTSAIIAWRTDVETQSWVRYGAAPDKLDRVGAGEDETTEHAVVLKNLTPATKYHYSIGTPEGALVGGDADHAFVTPPAAGARPPVRIWVIGDSGRANAEAASVRDSYKAYAGNRRTDLWLMLGDNAYDEGTDDQYQKAVFELYPDLLRQIFLWPTIGNHEYYGTVDNPDAMAYLSIFTLPTRGEAGGVASGTEYYYSFDFAHVHFVCLDSMVSSRKPDGMMLKWLEADLKQNTKNWLIAFWHHPPYSKGSHDSDTETELIEMRENALPILERYGVDLVLAGHSHSYERSLLLDGHYGTSDTLTAAMKKSSASGRRDDGGPYLKAGAGPSPREGAVYVVAGSSGQVSPGFSLDHPVMLVSLEKLGSLVIDINGLELDAAFLRETGDIDDRFAIRKGTGVGRPGGDGGGIGPRAGDGGRRPGDGGPEDGGAGDGPKPTTGADGPASGDRIVSSGGASSGWGCSLAGGGRRAGRSPAARSASAGAVAAFGAVVMVAGGVWRRQGRRRARR